MVHGTLAEKNADAAKISDTGLDISIATMVFCFVKKMRNTQKNHGGGIDAVCKKTVSGSADPKEG